MWKKIIAAVGCSVLLWGGSSAYAADDQQTAMTVYRDAYMARLHDDRAANTNIDLFGPNYHWELNADGQVLRNGSMHWHGEMSWDFTDQKTNATSHEDIPFYVEQRDNLLILYIQRENTWSKMSLPGVSPELIASWNNGTVDLFNDSMQAIKRVSLEHDTDKMQGLRIVMDVGKMLQVTNKYLDESKGKRSSEKRQAQQEAYAEMAQGLMGTELTVDWVVDKTTHQTITVSVDLTPFIRGYAQHILNEMAAGKIKLNDEERAMMESLGYFSELKFYMTYLGVKQNINLTVPEEVRKSAEDMMNMKDIQKGVSDAAKKS
ncbi:MAG: hypothetical protein K6F95_10455 [Selenomonas sp.]|uniref:hypothetical protein n=1 Tax=Selenomonas sp. TaxID=2053611 RepID=UPI0025F12630|nr:hypothetical protein [Selenomonas sp.]MCR5758311.1 hypothetical protein [Selenomonas sp.]